MIHIGTSGYSFPDWVGTAYPKGLVPSQMLRYYHNVWKFNAVELNFTYYRMPSYKTIAGMLRQIAGEMVFSVKAPGKITHEFWKAPSADLMELAVGFLDVLTPMREEGRLGPILFQFPWSFKRNEENIAYLERLSKVFDAGENRLVVEFRHDSWAVEESFELLEKIDIVPAVVDEPSIAGLFPYLPRQGRNVAYFRFHGRNPGWFESEGSERYNYNYSEDDLRSFALDVLEFHGHGLEVFVFFNNCHLGRAVHNALRFRDMIGGA
ncbi:MAG TPA: DUF72 domain-containing protein [Mesotoga infera]|jgi:uncharacterized protein YecE (DUF72 family)|uniref:DUF72 domain-containing protein n=1 Tax=Mesotoga infera TaxID=1236046 RepID=A0A7Z7LDJ6_9BACT|nr:DUF72 domain-containing protein [Mesotoga infera]NLI05937.1 DUF72 domain-containing protein [Thermotogaceae bacterium]SSC11695.1 conserved protein of unknown function [Mesotoga infera]HNR79762.1 DUF72 domain-containing protein [Mesotoga infera]